MDLRFSSITPLPSDADGSTRFRYERALPGHAIRGDGISLGEKSRADGTRTSALRFTTADRLSPLRDGRGYWRYIPTADGVRFITGHDYAPGFGSVLSVWRRDRPKASRCRTRPPARGAFADAPTSLSELAAP